MTGDYYKVLGIDRNAGEKEVRAAFRKLARQYHPDVNQGEPGADERFKEINEAHEVLSNPESRRLYDRYGERWRDVQRAKFSIDMLIAAAAPTNSLWGNPAALKEMAARFLEAQDRGLWRPRANSARMRLKELT